MQFNTQRGATTQGRAGQGWNQSLAVQAGIGSGLQSARLREQRSQHEQTLQQSQEQFDIKMGWEKSKFKMEQREREKQSDYQKKQAGKAERIGMFNTAIEFGKLTYMMNEEGMGADFGIGSGSAKTPSTGAGGGAAEGGYSVEQTSSQPGGDPSIDSQGETVRGTGSGGGGSWETFKNNWTGWAAGSATGGMSGSYVAQAVFGEGKTQSTAGGAAGGAIGGYYGSGGSGYGAAGGALVGGILGYLLG